MTTPKYPTEIEPWIWLQVNEQEGWADCGCHLAQDPDSGAKFNQCTMHAAAHLLLEALDASDNDGTWAGLIERATAGVPHLTGSPIYEGDKYPEIIGEAWQAMSVLSDAQELLDQPDPRCNDQINHAKRHLIRAFELAREQDAIAFRKAIMLIDCTLQDEEEHGTTAGAVFLSALLKQVPEHIASHGEDCETEAGCIYGPDAPGDDECGGKGLFMLREAIQLSNNLGGWND